MRNSSPISPLLIIGLIWIVLYGIFSNLRKAAEKQKQSKQPTAAPKQAPAEEKKAEPKPVPSPVRPFPPVREKYLGSLNVDSMEGIDPCHQEQMRDMDAPEAEETASAPARSGLTLSWSPDDVVRGFVYGEVLNRKRKT